MSLPNQSLKNRRVLVTGADGFIGSHLVERLVAEGAHVRALCIYNPQGSWGWLDTASADVRAAIDVRLGDIRDGRFVEELCKDVEIVFHLAALISIPYSYVAPASYVETNVTGTLHILEAARRTGVTRVIHTSTSEVYGTPKHVPITEAHPLVAQSPYAATKVAADQLALSYQRSFGTPVVVLRPFNTYGPRQSTRAVLPTILTQLLRGKREIELGRLDPRRDLTFVTDTCDGFVKAALAPDIEGSTIQLGTGVTVSIGELFTACCAAVGVEAVVKEDPRRVRPADSEVEVLLSDPSLAAEKLGWHPRVALAEGLRLTADWLRDNLNRYPVGGHHV
ncbi:MAG TPA: GDP-mannose 4,6-dehydratase [Polyangia bacterium]